ncbi:MAG: sporulation integral membrane protein YlbJ [Bacillota bacterium]
MTVLLLAGALVLLILVSKLARSLAKSRAGPALTACLAVAFAVAMVFYPAAAFESAVKGLHVWWNIVFPALLPFFIGSEILIGFGVVHFMGVLLEPVMRPVFNVPGSGSFVMAVGLASGFPIGSVLTARLRREGMCSKTEAERLMSFTNTADPLFMSGAVAVGIFGRPDVAGIIMVAHYLSSLSVGVVLRFYARGADRSDPGARHRQLLSRAFRAMLEARQKDGRPFGRLLGDAVRNSVNTLLLIGGFVIIFSVIIRMLSMVGAVAVISQALGALLAPCGVDAGVLPALVSGLFEVTLGCQMAGQSAAPLVQRVMIAGAVIGWSGLSVHAQVAAIVQGTDINLAPYIIARILHGILAGLYTVLLMSETAMTSVARVIPIPATMGPAGIAWWAAKSMLAIALVLTLLPALWHLPKACSVFRLRR